MKAFIKQHATALIIIGIIAAGIAAYANALPNEMFFDDSQGITDNAYIKDWKYLPHFFSESLTSGSGFLSSYWRPLLLIVYSAEWHLWGNSPVGFHAVNIFFHLASATLIFFLLRRLFQKTGPAAIAALLFAIHPVQTEAVTYVSGLGDPLSLFLMLLGTYLFVALRNKWKYAAILALFVLALMTKERSVVFPAILLLADLFVWRMRDFSLVSFWQFVKQSAIRITPFVLISGSYLWLRNTILLNIQNGVPDAPAVYLASIWTRAITFLSVLPDYFSFIFAPIGLHMERSFGIEIPTSFFDPMVLLGAAITLALGALGIFAWKKHPAYTFGVLWFFIMMFPVSGILTPVAGILYEHYLYAPIIGIAFLIGLSAHALYEKISNARGHNALLSVGIAVVMLLIGQTASQNTYWKDGVTFYTETLRYVPQSSKILNNLGMEYAARGNFTGAEEVYRSAIRFSPLSPIPLHNLGNLYYQTGQFDKAIESYRAAIKVSPKSVLPYLALHRLYQENGDKEKAEQVLRDLQSASNR